jgi:radical SAM protein with 4Fe4S-binding SPASM domain
MDIDRLQISVDAARPETYKKIRGGDLNVLERNIHNFLSIRNAKGKNTPILRLSFCQQKDNEGEEQEFREKWEGKADLVDFQKYIDLSNVAHVEEKDKDQLGGGDKKEYFCPDPFQRIVIDYNGNMFGCCCIGYNRYYKLGNLADMSILEAWNSEDMKKLRNSFLTQNLNPICLNCRAGIKG